MSQENIEGSFVSDLSGNQRENHYFPEEHEHCELFKTFIANKSNPISCDSGFLRHSRAVDAEYLLKNNCPTSVSTRLKFTVKNCLKIISLLSKVYRAFY